MQHDDRLTIAMLGTRGVPARYGGFETAVDEVGRRLVERGHRVRVYCRAGEGQPRLRRHLGMELEQLPALPRRSLETLSHTALSVGHLVAHRTDVAVLFNAANSPLLPALRLAGIPVATHVDGLEWRRAKWGTTGRRYYRAAESLAVRWSDALIADAQGIADYYTEEFGAPTRLIAYGAPVIAPGADRLRELGLEPESYHLVVARFEPENHVLEAVRGFVASASSRPLVVVGSAPYSAAYTEAVRAAAAADGRVRLLGGVWDDGLLDQLYANALTYVHGHSVGGTNPSLLRAIGAGAATIAWDVSFNREVLRADGGYFDDPQSLAARIDEAEADLAETRRRGRASAARAVDYDWDDVAARYEQLARDLKARRLRPAGSGRRRSGGGSTGRPRATADAR
jgi:glycosyltransferase involved in cell wall biosynthesis